MAEVLIQIAGRGYSISCREGEEHHVRRLEELIARHAESARRASGGNSGERTLLYLALILADVIDEAERNPPEGVSPVLLDNLADRLEAVATTLEEADALA